MINLNSLEYDFLNSFVEDDSMILEDILSYCNKLSVGDDRVNEVISELVKKGLINTWEENGEQVIEITKPGLKALNDNHKSQNYRTSFTEMFSAESSEN